jgi:hypothetical protein
MLCVKHSTELASQDYPVNHLCNFQTETVPETDTNPAQSSPDRQRHTMDASESILQLEGVRTQPFQPGRSFAPPSDTFKMRQGTVPPPGTNIWAGRSTGCRGNLRLCMTDRVT